MNRPGSLSEGSDGIEEAGLTEEDLPPEWMMAEGERGMEIEELLKAVPGAAVSGTGKFRVASLSADSRGVMPGSVFIAIKGFEADGHAYIGEAVKKGARAVVVNESWTGTVPGPAVMEIRVSDTRLAAARFAGLFSGHPSARINLVGVTGTNGKTTTTYLLRSILKAAGRPVSLFGTIGYDLDGEEREATHTTPDAIELQAMLARIAGRKDAFAVMEVSSHALELGRVEGCEFDLAVFTNLSQDHLDFHHSMEGYFQAKRRLFTELSRPRRKTGPVRAVINTDDPWGARLAGDLDAPAWTFGLEDGTDLGVRDLESSLQGLRFFMTTPAGDVSVQTHLVGKHNVYNILGAAAAGLHFGIPLDTISEGIAALKGVPGRFEKLESDRGFSVIVDYAHTEAALEHLLQTVRELTPGKVITVFGCGGDRDPGKRAPMGRVAAYYSDRVVMTSDNPRTEDPAAIISEIETGARVEAAGRENTVVLESISDRKEAIGKAMAHARKGDCVVVAGKGHEDYQIIG
ncbi:MAG TPA: UDP-N-acetylmuramoyl-L-alanyl-D-glutamate--2,6-diaminopimelate ligase, partial [Nitrospiria bacterium]|nr:UDP-N-acetylmuramoyl-L-alanyl-D-glutamate--2,6-diaminopimelate ligase [Nitrospiria bacterium]